MTPFIIPKYTDGSVNVFGFVAKFLNSDYTTCTNIADDKNPKGKPQKKNLALSGDGAQRAYAKYLENANQPTNSMY